MFVEGYIDKDYLDILLAQGHEPEWVCKTREDAKEKGYHHLPTDNKKTIVRIWIDMDLENFFSPEDIIQDNPSLINLMAVSKNETLRNFAIKKLKGI